MWWGWKFILFFIAILFLSIVFSPLAVFWGSKVLQSNPVGKVKRTIKIDPWILTFMTLGVSLLMTQYIDQRPLSSLGLHFYASWWKELGQGILIGGIGLVLAAVILRALSKHYRFKRPTFTNFSKVHAHFRGALGEELAFRGYPLQTLVGGIGLYPAIAVTSAFFGLLHYQRARWLGVVEAGLAGLLLSIAVLKTKALWLAVGIHFGWNLLEAVFRVRHEDVQPTQLHFRYFAAYIVVLLFMLMLILMPIGSHPEVEELWEEYIQSVK